MSFGEKLAKLLTQKEISKNAFAKKIGISQTSISNYIRDVSDPSISVIRKIKQYFPDVDIYDLLEIETGTGADHMVNEPSNEYNRVNYRQKYEEMYEKYLKAREDAIIAHQYLKILIIHCFTTQYVAIHVSRITIVTLLKRI